MNDEERPDEITLPKLVCLRCGHEWFPRAERKPKVCAKCASPYWDRPRIRNP